MKEESENESEDDDTVTEDTQEKSVSGGKSITDTPTNIQEFKMEDVKLLA